ncbi:putative capsular polysaccharide synthesis family protein [Anabaena sp. UHCC 0451]|uniref:putative capsular polysaccharide synthesis family protein n=1 Tax=Anabaena sp. UHCC 0451 TaxID=2055235 RepID=UPI002B1F1249|nr:putative capsular polysaccharide synthesis family protein [Anabaena sp. UHCC 0451]MEA5575033.1 putative capsular polysaccharide synthesis family protein [Anabaena sp. UHCC 0451]
MGKVGSSTIYTTLDTELKVANIVHVHYLSRKWLETRDPSISDNHPSVKQAKQIQKLKSTPGKHFKIISIVRDPIAKKVSGFFQNPHLYGLTQQELLTISPYDACDLIVKNRMKFYDAVEWFEQEFAEFTGIDIYQQSFNHSEKQQFIAGKNLDVMILRLEDFKDNETILLNLQKFIDFPIQKITNANVTEEKPFAALNKQVVDMIKFPDDFVNDIYASKYCQHFYTQTEINKFKIKWTGAKG